MRFQGQSFRKNAFDVFMYGWEGPSLLVFDFRTVRYNLHTRHGREHEQRIFWGSKKWWIFSFLKCIDVIGLFQVQLVKLIAGRMENWQLNNLCLSICRSVCFGWNSRYSTCTGTVRTVFRAPSLSACQFWMYNRSQVTSPCMQCKVCVLLRKTCDYFH